MIPPSPPIKESSIRLPDTESETVPPYSSDTQSQLWQDTVQKIDKQIINYNHHTLTRQNPPPTDPASAGAAPSSPRNATSSSDSTSAYDLADRSQPQPATAKAPEKNESLLKNAGKGALLLVATPVVLTGVAIYATGLMLEGCALVLKAIGGGGKKAMVKLSKM